MKIIHDDDFYSLEGQVLEVETIPLTLDFRICVNLNGEDVQTQKGTIHACPGYLIITGIANDKYIMNADSFLEKYESIKYNLNSEIDGVATKKIPTVNRQVIIPSVDYTIESYLGDIQGCKSEPIIRYKNGDYGSLSMYFFNKLYRII